MTVYSSRAALHHLNLLLGQPVERVHPPVDPGVQPGDALVASSEITAGKRVRLENFIYIRDYLEVISIDQGPVAVTTKTRVSSGTCTVPS